MMALPAKGLVATSLLLVSSEATYNDQQFRRGPGVENANRVQDSPLNRGTFIQQSALCWSGRLTKPEFPEIVGQKRHYYFFVVYSTSPWGHGEGKEIDP
jgi:hypothetical protein